MRTVIAKYGRKITIWERYVIAEFIGKEFLEFDKLPIIIIAEFLDKKW